MRHGDHFDLLGVEVPKCVRKIHVGSSKHQNDMSGQTYDQDTFHKKIAISFDECDP